MVTLTPSEMYQKSAEGDDLPIGTEMTSFHDDEVDSKEFQKELMSKVFPLSEENDSTVSDIGNDTVCNERLDTQNSVVKEEVEGNVPGIKQSENCTLSTVEDTTPGTHDEIVDSKDFQKELMGKVLPLSDETLNVPTGSEIAAVNTNVDDEHLQDTSLNRPLPNNLNIKTESCSLPPISEPAGDKSNDTIGSRNFLNDSMSKVIPSSNVVTSIDKNDISNDKKDNKRKSNLLPLDAFFSPSFDDSSASKKKKGNEACLGESIPNKLSSANIKVEQEVVVGKKRKELEDGEIGDEELEEGELRELEEGELPEDIELVRYDASRQTSVIKKSIPIDYDDFNRKRKVALLVAYCGAGFHGMQKNPEVETIELRLMEALAAIRAIRPDLKNEFLLNNNNQISFNRAARTDKGVSAARQVVSLKLIASENFLLTVNNHLPPEIRVFGMERVTKSFDAKCSCSGRSYEYLVPTVAFAPSKEIMDSTYRLSDEQFDKVNSILGQYIGTHNFHNFTSGKRFSDKSAIRYITDFKGSKPFECRGHEFISLIVQGQSFLIHQIRKMIGLCMAICRGYCGEDTVGKGWLEAKLDIPKAPGLGLLLNRVNYKAYNQKNGSDGRHNPLTWEDCELEVERYKIERLWHTIIEEEIKKSSLVHWLKTLNNHTYTEAGMNAPMNSDYRGKKGIFPSIRDKRRHEGREEPGPRGEKSPNSK